MTPRLPRIELLAPDLDRNTIFVPGYDLLELNRQKINGSSLSPHQVIAIALALWELSGIKNDQGTPSPWSAAKLDGYRGA